MPNSNVPLYLYCDLETGSTDIKTTQVLSCALSMVQDKQLIAEEVIYIQPQQPELVEDGALEVNGFTRDQIMQPPFLPHAQAFMKIKSFLNIGVDPYKKNKQLGDKYFFTGYNIQAFDFPVFLDRIWSIHEKGSYVWSYLHFPPLDVLGQWASILRNYRHMMPNFKLAEVCKFAQIEVDESRLHDAKYDLEITRQLHEKGNDIIDAGFKALYGV